MAHGHDVQEVTWFLRALHRGRNYHLSAAHGTQLVLFSPQGKIYPHRRERGRNGREVCTVIVNTV